MYFIYKCKMKYMKNTGTNDFIYKCKMKYMKNTGTNVPVFLYLAARTDCRPDNFIQKREKNGLLQGLFLVFGTVNAYRL